MKKRERRYFRSHFASLLALFRRSQLVTPLIAARPQKVSSSSSAKGSMRFVKCVPGAGAIAPPRGRAARVKLPASPVVVAAAAGSSAASSSSSSDARARGASAKAVASSSGRPAVDAPTSPEIVGRGSKGESSSPSGPLLKAVRSSR